MKLLRFTLLSDGPTDANLLPIIRWCLKQTGGVPLPDGRHAELWRLPKMPRGLADRMATAIDLYPCEVLIVHRDAEKQPRDKRADEIRRAHDELVDRNHRCPAVTAVIPVRMSEAWLCFDESAIRKAAGNPNGTIALDLPSLKRVESRPAKDDIDRALRTASELKGRRLDKFDVGNALRRIVDHIEDFSPLRALPSFQAFELSVRSLKDNGWRTGFYG
jgi:hypothetical protein